MSKELYLSRLALEIEKHEENGNVRKAQELHNYFLKVANIRDLDPEAFADDYREEQDLMPKLNEEYYGEYQDNPDEDIVDDSLGSDLDVNEMNLTDDADMDNEEIYGLFNTLRSKLGEDPGAANLIDQLEEMYDATVMGKR